MIDPVVFFNKVHDDFQLVLSKSGSVSRFYRLAGYVFCLQFADKRLVPILTPALAHLEVDLCDAPDLTICIWDSPSVKLPWDQYQCGIRGEVNGYDTRKITTVVDIHTKVLHMYDRERNLALYWIRDKKDLPWWIGGSPFQLILHWWLKERNLQLVHAAVVANQNKGVLLAGKSGAGKSTTALSCMKMGMKYVSEDYCLVSDLPEISAYSVYNSAKVEQQTLRWFPELEKQIENPSRKPGDKAFIFHYKFQPQNILLCCSLRAIISLKIESGVDSWLEPTVPNVALTAMSMSTMWQLTHSGPLVFSHLKRIANALPCYNLHLGSDLSQAPQLIGKLL